MVQDAEVCIKAVRACLLAAGSRGVDVAGFVAARGLDPAMIADPYARVPHALVASLWEQIPVMTGDDAFGIHAAETVFEIGFDVVDYALLHCATVGDALGRLIRFSRLLHDAAETTLTESGGRAEYAQRFYCEPPMPRHLVEFIFAMWVLRVRRAVPAPLELRGIAFAHAAPTDLAEHRRLFGAPLSFAADKNAIVFDSSLLETPMRAADPVLLALMDRQAQELIDKLPERSAPLGDVRKTICEDLENGNPELDRVARRLRTSRRSLQRRMQHEGTTFQSLVDEVRRDLVLERLRDPATTLTEVAFMAGFSDTTTFHRAFRRWTGSTPSEFRRGAQRV